MTTSTPESTGEPLAILAAGGNVPFQVASAAEAAGRKVLVIGLEGEADDRLKAFPFQSIKWGQLGRIEDLVSAHGARDVVLIGSVSRRPDFRSLGVDLGTLRLLPRILKSMVGGDDTVLGNLIAYLEERGFSVIGAHEVAPELVAEAGQLAGPRVPQTVFDDARVAMDAARAIGERDIGQAAVAVNGLVVAVEAAEGTDAMLERVGDLHARGRVKWSGRAGVLAKRSKPQQDLRVDMPTIGPRTVLGVAKAGLAGIVIEAGRVMIAERAETIKAAGESGTFVLAAADGAARPSP
jgi:UDP-2,3-diacylglucosamine hydrolase